MVVSWTASGQQVKDLETRRLMGSINGVRKGFRASADGVTKVLLFKADLVRQGHVVSFSKKGFFFISSERQKLQSSFVRRNNVYEVDGHGSRTTEASGEFCTASPAESPALQISPLVGDASEDLRGDLNS